MKPKKLALELCRLEGKKSQVNIAQMTEIVGKLADIVGPMMLNELLDLAIELQKLYDKRNARTKKR